MRKKLLALAIILVTIFGKSTTIYAGPGNGGPPPTPPPEGRRFITFSLMEIGDEYELQESVPTDALCQ